MPRSCSVGFAERLLRSSTRLTTLFRITRPDFDGNYLDENLQAFTSLDKDLEVDGIVYASASGVVPSAVRSTEGTGIDNLDVVGILRTEGLAEGDLLKGLYDAAQVEVALAFWDRPDLGELTLMAGYLGEVRETAGLSFLVEFRSLMQWADQTIGSVFTPNCQNILGDERCGVDLAPYTFTGTVVAVLESRRVFTVSGGGIPALATGYFGNGEARLLTGSASGLKMEIKGTTKDAPTAGVTRVELQQRMRASIAPGDSVQLVRGCDKVPATCKGVYNNFVNYRGFPHVPGLDKVLRVVN